MTASDATLGKLGSLWLDSERRAPRPPLRDDLVVDVAVLGAGITGLTTALLLARDGARVAVLEARTVGAGTTGYTTAKLTSLHGLSYARLIQRHGEELAGLYGDANESGIARIADLVEELGIRCDFGRKANLTYAERERDVESIRREVDAALRVGLPASLVTEIDLPFPVAAAVRFADQAELHPIAYLDGLADALLAAGGELYEHTRAVDLDEGLPCRVRTEHGAVVSADHAIIATHVPFTDRGLFFARTHAERSYVVAAEVDEDAPADMYLSTEKPAHSIRVHRLADGRRFLLVGGEGHKTGQADEVACFGRLAAYARARFGVSRIDYHWAAHDNVPLDSVPYVGRLHPGTRNVLVATGYRKWGLAAGTAAAELLADLVSGRANRWARLFDPSRVRARASVTSFVKENTNVGLHFFADRLRNRGSADDLGRDAGRVVGDGLKQRALYRDQDGDLHALSARCTHLGCIVAWNDAERTWDCPCHGSRFAATGEVLQGPAVAPLTLDPGTDTILPGP